MGEAQEIKGILDGSESAPAEEKRGRGRPRKDGSPAQPSQKTAPAPKKEAVRTATETEWAMLEQAAVMGCHLLATHLHQRNPAFPMSPEYLRWREEATKAMVRKYGSMAARFSIEANFVLAWGMSAMAMTGGSIQIAIPRPTKAPSREEVSSPAPVAAPGDLSKVLG